MSRTCSWQTPKRRERCYVYAHRCIHPTNYDGKINFTIHMFYITLMPHRIDFHKHRSPFSEWNFICDNEIDLLTFLLLQETINFAYVTKLFVLFECVTERTKLFEIILTLLVFHSTNIVQIHKSCEIYFCE